MSSESQPLSSQDVSYIWTNKDKTEFVLHYDGAGIVRGVVGPGRKSFSIEVDDRGMLTFRRMVDAKKEAAQLWSKGHRVSYAGGKAVVVSSSASKKREPWQSGMSHARLANSVPHNDFSPERFPYLHPDGQYARHLSQTTDQVRYINRVKLDELREEFRKLIECAPRRADRGKQYFVKGHNGIPSGTSASNRYEEHLAIALWKQERFWPRADGSQFYLLDYQFPLQARQSDKGIGKVDLVGLTTKRRLVVIELKVRPKSENDRGETPAAALLQGLRYAAIVQANLDAIAREVEHLFKVTIDKRPPIVQLLAPEDWWQGWTQLAGSTRNAAGNWEIALAKLVKNIEGQIGVAVECVALNVKRQNLTFGGSGLPPLLSRAPEIQYIELGYN